ncbi:MAG: ribonuclease P protein component [SAR324 cluster bacterium]|nr:ribonuclease P protein component [SAR324 cluster bacterium]MBL7034154.1 ribonuclease P protein component [SAR324 cluster bacterium]
MIKTFPKAVRLHHSRLIREVFEQGSYQSLGPIGAKYKLTESEFSRFSISVKKKVGNAPCRNHIKRLLREAVRVKRSCLKSGYDICFFVSRPPKRPLDSSYVLCQVSRFFNNLNNDSCD